MDSCHASPSCTLKAGAGVISPPDLEFNNLIFGVIPKFSYKLKESNL